MSRLEAALRRATTGVVDPQVPDAFEEREPVSNVDWTVVTDEPAEQPWPEPEAPAADLEASERRRSPRLAATDAETPRFREFSSKHADKLIVSTAMSAPLREHYRQLGATLHHAQAETGLKVVMVSSALPEEGKTLTATNIALTLSESYQRNVLLIDADLRRPSLDEVFQLPKVFGLSEALSAAQDRPISLVQVSQRLSVLLAGAPDSDPMSKLTSDRMKRLIAEASAAFEWVIIDTPPVAILTDAKLLGAMVDTALLVVRAGKTPAALVERAVEAIGRDRIMGVVLNRAETRHNNRDNSYYASYYYSSRPRK